MATQTKVNMIKNMSARVSVVTCIIRQFISNHPIQSKQNQGANTPSACNASPEDLRLRPKDPMHRPLDAHEMVRFARLLWLANTTKNQTVYHRISRGFSTGLDYVYRTENRDDFFENVGGVQTPANFYSDTRLTVKGTVLATIPFDEWSTDYAEALANADGFPNKNFVVIGRKGSDDRTTLPNPSLALNAAGLSTLRPVPHNPTVPIEPNLVGGFPPAVPSSETNRSGPSAMPMVPDTVGNNLSLQLLLENLPPPAYEPVTDPSASGDWLVKWLREYNAFGKQAYGSFQGLSPLPLPHPRGKHQPPYSILAVDLPQNRMSSDTSDSPETTMATWSVGFHFSWDFFNALQDAWPRAVQVISVSEEGVNCNGWAWVSCI